MKKGSIVDIPFIAVMIVVIVIVAIIGYFIFSQFGGVIQASPHSNARVNQSINTTTAVFNLFDPLLVVMWAGTNIGAFILAFRLRDHPIFAFLLILIAPIIIIITAIFTNLFYSFSVSNLQINTIVNTNFPLTIFLVTNLPILTMIMMGFQAIVLWTGRRLEPDVGF